MERTFAPLTAAPPRAGKSRPWVRFAVVPLIAGLIAGSIIGLAIESRLNVTPGSAPLPRIRLTETAYEASACRTTPTEDPLALDGVYYYRIYNVTLTLSNTGRADGFAYVRIDPDSNGPRYYFVPSDSRTTKTPVVFGSRLSRSFDECNSSIETPQVYLIGYNNEPQIGLTDTTFEPYCTDGPAYFPVYRFTFVLVNTGETDGVAVVTFNIEWQDVSQGEYFVPRHSQIFQTAEIRNGGNSVDGGAFASSRECLLHLVWNIYALRRA